MKATLFLAALFSFVLSTEVSAQVTDVPAATDTTVTIANPGKVVWDTSYARDVSSGTWTQGLGYGIQRGRVTLTANGGFARQDLLKGQGLGVDNGSFGGQLDYSLTRHWLMSMSGTFNSIGTRDLISHGSQRQNRLRLSTRYSVSPLRVMKVWAVLSTEAQQDHGLTVRPLGQEEVRLLTRYNAAGESTGVDSFFVHDHRDSTYMSARQDGLTFNMDWRPRTQWMITADAVGTRVNPKTRSQLRDFGRSVDGTPLEVSDRTTFESPNQYEASHAQASYTGRNGWNAVLALKRVKSSQQYFDKLIRNQEHQSFDQRGANAHAQYMPFRGGLVYVEGTLERSLSEYLLRANRNNLVSTRTLHSLFSYNPSGATRASVDLLLDHKDNERQATGNGRTITHALAVNGARRLNTRLGVDLTSNVSLTSYQYQDQTLDQDNLRTYANLGGVCVVSERCSTFVHLSASRGHSIAIDPTRSANNNVQTTYQVDSQIKFGLNSRINLYQSYLINAVYQIYDDENAESRNVLSRIKRVDTTISDSLFTQVTFQLVHNFLFRDSGSFTRAAPDEAREYAVGNETYQQTLAATMNIYPAEGINLFATQSLGNLKTHLPVQNTRLVSNRWNLILGATVQRTIGGSALLQGSVQHINAYTERRKPDDPLNEQNDWIAGLTFHKEF